MTLAERLQQEIDILRLLQIEFLRLSRHSMALWEASQHKNTKHLEAALKAVHRWENGNEFIERLERILNG